MLEHLERMIGIRRIQEIDLTMLSDPDIMTSGLRVGLHQWQVLGKTAVVSSGWGKAADIKGHVKSVFHYFLSDGHQRSGAAM